MLCLFLSNVLIGPTFIWGVRHILWAQDMGAHMDRDRVKYSVLTLMMLLVLKNVLKRSPCGSLFIKIIYRKLLSSTIFLRNSFITE